MGIDDQSDGQILCQSKFMVKSQEYQAYDVEDVLDLTYLPKNYQKYHNLSILNQQLIQKKTITFRILIGIIMVMIVPIILSIFSEEWQLFVYPLLVAVVYYIIGYFLFTCLCPKRSCFKNKSFKTR